MQTPLNSALLEVDKNVNIKLQIRKDTIHRNPNSKGYSGIQEWMEEYCVRRPQEGLNNLTPELWKQIVLKNQYLKLSTV